MRDKLIDVAGWISVVVFTGSLVGLLLGVGAWLLAVTVAAAIVLVLVTAADRTDEAEDGW